MGWQDAEDLLLQRPEVNYNSSRIKFLKMEKGSSIDGLFFDEPKMKQVVWDGTAYQKYVPGIDDQKKMQTRFMIGFFAGGISYQAEFQDISFKGLVEKNKTHPVSDYKYKITRSNKGYYSFEHVSKMTDDEKKSIDGKKLPDIQKPKQLAEDEIPF